MDAPLKKNLKKVVDCRIDLFQQMKRFDHICLTQPGITGNYRSVYFALLSINNSKFWAEVFEVDFQYTIELSCVDKDTYRRAMDFFYENGFFDYYVKGINKYARARVSLKVLTDNPVGNVVGNAVGNTPDNPAGNAAGNVAPAAHYIKTVNNKQQISKQREQMPLPVFDDIFSYFKKESNWPDEKCTLISKKFILKYEGRQDVINDWHGKVKTWILTERDETSKNVGSRQKFPEIWNPYFYGELVKDVEKKEYINYLKSTIGGYLGQNDQGFPIWKFPAQSIASNIGKEK